MIILQKLEWSNFRSYGDSNYVQLDTHPLVQLLGDNGAGKTSIPLMLQEVLYGKNIKGVKKDALVNRYTGEPGYSITLCFKKDASEYVIKLKRTKAKLNLQLLYNGEDISSHTATNTYKTIASIIGIPDFKTFCQLTYQSTTDALDFLTATDTSRKRFLISLLDLSEYLVHQEAIKKDLKQVVKKIDKLGGQLTAHLAWKARHESLDMSEKVEVFVPEMPHELLTEQNNLKRDLDNIQGINRKVANNNKLIEELEALGDVAQLAVNSTFTDADIEKARKNCWSLGQKILETNRELKGLTNEKTKCPTCGQALKNTGAKELGVKKDVLRVEAATLAVSLKEASKRMVDLNRMAEENKEIVKKTERYVVLCSTISPQIPTISLDSQELSSKLWALSKEHVDIQAEIHKATRYNQEVAAHNSRICMLKAQVLDVEKDIGTVQGKLRVLEEDAAYLKILRNAFSTNGLVSFKVEASVKALERSINTYLSEFSGFRIRFKLKGEKLNVEVFDDLRNIIDIQTVSTGELNRINISTGLAIRKLLSTLTATKLNFLFLDEIVGTLDAEGKEKLFEILQKQDLNTIIVAHEETHPLIPKLEIRKKGSISYLGDL